MPKEINTNLTIEQKKVMFEEATEPPGSSKLNQEKREGSYHCDNCGIKLFESKTKYESGSLVATGSNTYVLAYRGSGMPGMIKMFGIGGNGKNIKQLYSTKHRNTNGHNSLAKVDSDTYALAHHGPSNDGYIKSSLQKHNQPLHL